MRIAIIGAGITGVSTAFELAGEGHEVTVFDRCGAVAAESSFAPGGLYGTGWASTWIAPGIAWSPARLAARALLSLKEASAGAKALAFAWHHRRERQRSPTDRAAALIGLALYGQRRLGEVVQSLGLSIEACAGTLVPFRDRQQEQRAQPWMDLLRGSGVSVQRLDADEVRHREPGLALAGSLHAGALLREEGGGNCRLLAQGLKAHAQMRGAQFLLGHEVRRIRPGPSVELDLQVAGRAEVSTHDAVIVSAAGRSPSLIRPLGIVPPMLPLWGHTVTAPLSTREGGPEHPPRHCLVDLRHRVSLTPLGGRIRVAGGHGLTERSPAGQAKALRQLCEALELWFPGAVDWGRAQTWSGCQAMPAGGLPFVGPAGPPNVWVNTGQGASGMALACGSARILADQIAGRPAFSNPAPS